MEPPRRGGPAVAVMGMLVLVLLLCGAAEGWTGEIHGRVVCDVCGDSSIGPEDHVLEVVHIPCGSLEETSILFKMNAYVGDLAYRFVQLIFQQLQPPLSELFKGLPLNMRDLIISRVVFVFLAGAEVAILCITKSGEVINYQAFTNSKGIYTVAETMPESDRWESCLARPISSYHEHCTRRGDAHSGIKFTYNLSSGHSHAVKPFLYKPASLPMYCS